MGHWLYGYATRPRDERSSLCSGGWNRKKNMCYRKGPRPSFGNYFVSGNPRVLAKEISRRPRGQHAQLLGLALNNIDNYVSWMWNLDAYARSKK